MTIKKIIQLTALLLMGLLTLSILKGAEPRNQLPETPSQIWQNDLDLRDMIDDRISRDSSSYCIDNPTLCVDADNNQVEIGDPDSNLSYDSTNYELDISTDVNLTGTLTVGGQAFFSNGTIAAPSISFTNSTGMGFRRKGSNNIAYDISSTDVWEIDSTGAIIQPSQPSFLVVAATQNNVTGDGTNYTVLFSSEIKDSNGDFSSPNFTAPINGLYEFNAGVSFQDLTTSHNILTIRIVTSNRNYTRQVRYVNSTGYYGINISVLADMDANDTAHLVVIVSGSSKAIDVYNDSDNYTYFSGSLIN